MFHDISLLEVTQLYSIEWKRGNVPSNHLLKAVSVVQGNILGWGDFATTYSLTCFYWLQFSPIQLDKQNLTLIGGYFSLYTLAFTF